MAKPKLPDTKTYRILVSSTAVKEGDDYLGPLFAGIREEAANLEIDITHYTRAAVPNPESVSQLGVNGVLCVAIQSDDQPLILELHDEGIPVVGLAQRSRIGSLPVICTDNYAGMTEVVQYLLELGHTRMAYITWGVGTSDVHERCLAFQNTLCQAGVQIEPANLLVTASPMNQAYLEHWFDAQTTAPTAIIISAYSVGSVLSMLAKRGLHVPKDVSIVTIDDPDSARGFSPPLAALNQPVREMARRGLSKLISMIRGEDDGSPEVMPTRLIKRESVGPAANTTVESSQTVDAIPAQNEHE